MRVQNGITVILSQLYSVYIWNDSHENPHILCILSVSQSLVSLSMINSFALQAIVLLCEKQQLLFFIGSRCCESEALCRFCFRTCFGYSIVTNTRMNHWCRSQFWERCATLERFGNISDRNDVPLIFLVY